MNTTPFLLHSLSPLRTGIGQAADVIDLPTARMKATGIPFMPGSSVKSVLRDARNTNGATRRSCSRCSETRWFERTSVTSKHLMVAVKDLDDDAFVITPFFTGEVRGGAEIWAK
jgi:CRISPR/Cas system CMR subunit Cmr4 (Cas7 group RAMP superfamily)